VEGYASRIEGINLQYSRIGEDVCQPLPVQASPDLATSLRPGPGSELGRTVTASQVANAIMQLRERPRLSAAAQVHAVLKALDLTVVPDPATPARPKP